MEIRTYEQFLQQANANVKINQNGVVAITFPRPLMGNAWSGTGSFARTQVRDLQWPSHDGFVRGMKTIWPDWANPCYKAKAIKFTETNAARDEIVGTSRYLEATYKEAGKPDVTVLVSKEKLLPAMEIGKE